MPTKKIKVNPPAGGGKLKNKTQKNSGSQPHIAEDAHKTQTKKAENSRSLSERRPRKVVGGSSAEQKSAFSSSASGLTSRTDKKKIGNLKVDVYDLKGKVLESINLPKEIFGAKINKQLISQAVRVYLANQRRGTVSTKTRGEVEGSTRKIYKQKGTGRARHGSIRAPIFVHGGLVFGPKPRDYSLNFPKKMKKAALSSALSVKAKEGNIKIIKGLEKIEPKTKLMAEVLKNLEISGQKILLVLPDKLDNAQRSARNIKNIDLILARQLNTYEVLRSKTLLLTKDSLEILEKFYAKGN